MNRLQQIEEELLKVIDDQEGKMDDRDETLNWERLHMASSARVAWELALSRGVDPELAACATAVHDLGRILTGRQKNHAEAGYEPVQEFLKSTGLFTVEEIRDISLAVRNHSSKTVEGTMLEEIVKDADVIDCYQYGCPFDRPEKEVRYARCMEKMNNGR